MTSEHLKKLSDRFDLMYDRSHEDIADYAMNWVPELISELETTRELLRDLYNQLKEVHPLSPTDHHRINAVLGEPTA